MDYDQTLDYLFSLQKFGIKFGLSSTRRLLDALGRPHEAVPCLHLTGSNGKGSVGAAACSILTEAGYKTGFFTSPHLVDFEERFVIGREMIPKSLVPGLTERVRAVCSPEEPPTFFEFVTAMAFLYFAEAEVDLAVMETGMGGRLDATNVASSLVGVITNISLEHTDYLGRTLSEIAGEKAGIIKPGLPVVTGEKRPKIREIFDRKCRESGGELFVAGRDFRVRTRKNGRFNYHGLDLTLKDLEISLIGPHQVQNAGTALAAIELLGRRGFSCPEDSIRRGLARVYWPGRLETVLQHPRVILDGAHNPAAAKALAAALPALGGNRVHLVLGIMADKDMAGIMALLTPLADRLYLTRPVYSRAADPETLARFAGEFRGDLKIVPRLTDAVDQALSAAGPDDLVVISGSLFTVGEARAYLADREKAPAYPWELRK